LYAALCLFTAWAASEYASGPATLQKLENKIKNLQKKVSQAAAAEQAGLAALAPSEMAVVVTGISQHMVAAVRLMTVEQLVSGDEIFARALEEYLEKNGLSFCKPSHNNASRAARASDDDDDGDTAEDAVTTMVTTDCSQETLKKKN